MHRTVLQYLDDILEAIGNIEEDTSGISYDEFATDRRRRDAVIRNLIPSNSMGLENRQVSTHISLAKIYPSPSGW